MGMLIHFVPMVQRRIFNHPMHRAFYTLLFIGFVSVAPAIRPETKYLKKANESLEKGNLRSAKGYYEKALEKNPESYEANLGMGLLLSDLLGNYSAGLPFLEKALSLSKQDTAKDLAFALALCYQYNGDFDKAISFFRKLDNCVDYESEIDLEAEVKKRIADCRYASAHSAEPADPNIFIVNAGRTINSDMPEYVPVLTPNGEFIFTSKRKDTDREELNHLDGKYFESMYITSTDSLGIKSARRYTIPDRFLKSQFSRYHESVISISPDGRTLFIYKDNHLYEIKIDERLHTKPQKLSKSVNFNYYQNHAFITRDGNTLFFTSDAKGGRGGNDIYSSVKKDGKWGKPVNLGAVINTPFDEESPFLSDDGKTLYFSSKGHEGFGNFDIYRSTFQNGSWTTPENIGKPYNSTGHDIFMITDSSQSTGYFSSSRKGGFGDMDIYKIIYIDKIRKTCPEKTTRTFPLSIVDENTGGLRNQIVAAVPADYRVLSYEWELDGKMQSTQPVLDHTYPSEGRFIVSSKIVALCDTCLEPIVSCTTIVNDIKTDQTPSTEPVIVSDPVAAATTDKEKSAINDVKAPVEKKGQKDPEAHVAKQTKITGTDAAAKTLSGRTLSETELTAIGFDLSPLLFDFNKTSLRADALEILSPNITLLKDHPELKVDILGYGDARGSKRANISVSLRRAKSVHAFLLQNGVSASQVGVARGKGATDFVNECSEGVSCDEARHQENRRVVFVFSRK